MTPNENLRQILTRIMESLLPMTHLNPVVGSMTSIRALRFQGSKDFYFIQPGIISEPDLKLFVVTTKAELYVMPVRVEWTPETDRAVKQEYWNNDD